MKERILDAAIKVFNEKGLKFTMSDIAKELSMSKKTIYTVFQSKELLLLDMVDYGFDKVKESENAIVSKTNLTTEDKIRQILGVLPEGYRDIDFRKLVSLKNKFPKVYRKVEERLETGWENTFDLIRQGIEEGCIRPIQITILKTMFEATLEQFFQRDVLIANQISYSDALDHVVEILLDGIVIR